LPARPRHRCRAVIFLDTFEAVAQGRTGDADKDDAEEWIRKLCGDLNDAGVLVVIAGQNRLAWERRKTAWGEERYLVQRRLDGLTRPYAATFLQKCEIEAGDLQTAILASSREGNDYLPLKLGLLADAVAEEREQNREPDPESFRLDPDDLQGIVKRFLRSLPTQEHQDWMERLALTSRFDEMAARNARMPGVPDSAEANIAWRSLRGYSFVSGITDDGRVTAEVLPPDEETIRWRTLKEQVRDALRETMTREQKESHHRFWRTHWQSVSATLTDEYAALGWYHWFHIDQEEAGAEWVRLAEEARGKRDMAAHLRLLSWVDSVLAPEKAVPRNLVFGYAAELQQASLGDREANLRKAISLYEALLLTLDAKKEPQSWASTQNNLGEAYRNLSDVRDKEQNLGKAITSYEAALEERTRERFPQDWAMTQNNLGIALFHQGNLEAARDAFLAAARAYRAMKWEDDALPLEEVARQIALLLDAQRLERLVEAAQPVPPPDDAGKATGNQESVSENPPATGTSGGTPEALWNRLAHRPKRRRK